MKVSTNQWLSNMMTFVLGYLVSLKDELQNLGT